MLGFLEWIREVSGVDHAVHLFLDPFNDMPLLTSIEANISHEENPKVFFLIKFPLKLIYSTEWAGPGKVPVQHLDIVLTDATVFEQEKFLLINNIAKGTTDKSEFFDSLNVLYSRQKLHQALKSWSNSTLVLFGKEIHCTYTSYAVSITGLSCKHQLQ